MRGTEFTMSALGMLCTVVLAGLNGPGIAFAGPLSDKLGAAKGLHPYRRSNVMDCFAMVGTIVPIVSSFLLIAAVGTQGYEGPDGREETQPDANYEAEMTSSVPVLQLD